MIGVQIALTSAKIFEQSNQMWLHEDNSLKLTSSWPSVQKSSPWSDKTTNKIINKQHINQDVFKLQIKTEISKFLRQKRSPVDEIPPYIGKGRIKPFRPFVTPETTTQTGINKRMPKYFLNTSSDAQEKVNTNSREKTERVNARNSNSAISAITLLNSGKNLTSEIFGDKKKSVPTAAPRPIVKGERTRKRVLKGVSRRPRKGIKFNRNNVARGKIKKRRKSTRGTSPFPIVSTPNSETN